MSSIGAIGGSANMEMVLAALRMAVAQQQAVVAMLAQAGQTTSALAANGSGSVGTSVNIVV